MSLTERHWPVGVLVATAFAHGACGAPANAPPSAPAAENPIVAAPAQTTKKSDPMSSTAVAPTEPALDCDPLSIEVPELVEHKKLAAPLPPIEGAETLAPFFERAARLLRGHADDHVRIGVYGDSNLTRDQLTGEMRRMLQLRYGDGGHGFIALGRPWRWYLHEDARHDGLSGAWKNYAPSTHLVRDKMYGLAGISSESEYPKATAYIATAKAGAEVGTAASRFGIFYLARPGGGRFSISADGKKLVEIDTEGPEKKVAIHRFELPEGPHRVELEVLTRKKVRTMGSYMETKKPGFIVDSYGIGGVSYLDLSKIEPTTVQQMMRLRANDLLMFWIGTNLHGASKNPESVRRIVKIRRDVDPKLPILIVSPPDHVKRKTDARSAPQIIRVVEKLRETARENGVAFWDFRAAQGGDAAMAKMVHIGYAAHDLYHLTQRGSAYMAKRLTRALWLSFDEYLKKHPQAGCRVAASGAQSRKAGPT